MQLLLLLLLTISYFQVISSRISGAFNIAIIGELDILIHTLRVEGDTFNRIKDFNSLTISIHTLRVEGDADIDTAFKVKKGISIHTLRVEGDRFAVRVYKIKLSYFNPHPPCGG